MIYIMILHAVWDLGIFLFWSDDLSNMAKFWKCWRTLQKKKNMDELLICVRSCFQNTIKLETFRVSNKFVVRKDPLPQGFCLAILLSLCSIDYNYF